VKDLFVPALLLIVLPAVYFLGVRGLLRRRSIVAGCVLAAAGLLWSALPANGLDYVYIKRFNLLLAGVTVSLIVMRGFGVGPLTERRVWRPALVTLALLAAVAYVNFFAFHGFGTFVHLHDVAHYYLGSKYFDELGYTDLYTAMLRAEAESYDDHFTTIQARDLATNEIVHIRSLLTRSGSVKARFTSERWRAFRADVDFFHRTMGRQYGEILQDHGFNPTPAWAVIGGAVANLVPGGSERGIHLLTALDPLLLALTFVAATWAFGFEAALLATILFCVMYGATFGWNGGAFLRYLWFSSLVAAACCLQRGRPLASGALLGVSAMLRVFPAAFALPVLIQGGVVCWRERRLPRLHARFAAGLVLTATVLVGLTRVLVFPFEYRGDRSTVSRERFLALEARRKSVHRVQLVVICVALAAFAAGVVRRVTMVEAMAMGIPLLFAAVDLASYYYVFLVILVLVERDRPLRLALVFALEVLTYALLLFDYSEATLHAFRSLLLVYLFVALYWRRPLPAGERLVLAD
jgi:hypothetical protein